MRASFRATLIPAATLALALAACSTETTPPPEGETGSDTGPAQRSSEVAIDDFRFTPPRIEVAAGTTVTFSNEDATAHTVTRGSEDDPMPAEFDQRVDEQGQTIEWTFDEPGDHAYFCTLHPFMEGTVTVAG